MDRIICISLKKQDAAVYRIIQMLTRTVTMKMLESIGVNAKKGAIIWLVFTEGVAINSIAWKS